MICSPEDQLGDEVHDSEALGGSAVSAGEHDGTKSHDAGRCHTAPLAPNFVTNDTCDKDNSHHLTHQFLGMIPVAITTPRARRVSESSLMVIMVVNVLPRKHMPRMIPAQHQNKQSQEAVELKITWPRPGVLGRTDNPGDF